MLTATTYRRICAWVFILFFTASWSLKVGHVFLNHHDHKHLSCSVPQDGSAHIHDERYTGNDCSICAFVLSIPEVPAVLTFSTPLPPMILAEARFIATTAPHQTVCTDLLVRGPPASI